MLKPTMTKPNIERKFVPTPNIKRRFVRHRHPDRPSGQVWHKKRVDKPVTLSVIIPTADADRNGCFLKLLEQLFLQTFKDLELIVVRGDTRQGRAINIGAALSTGKYLLTLDDDTALPDTGTLAGLVRIMDTRPDIGIAGGNNVVPADAPPFVKRVMREIPRRSWEPVKTIVDSDLAEHPCMIMRTEEFKTVGGENEMIPRGLDPYLREEFRKAGKRVVVVPDVLYHHLPPTTFPRAIRQFLRNGKMAAYCNRNYPQWVIETPDDHSAEFPTRRPFMFRVIRHAVKLAKKIRLNHWVYVILTFSYFVGYGKGLLSARQNVK